MSDLLTCPFCGGALVWSDTYSEYHHPVAKCILSGHKFKKGMIGQWNRRALPAVQPDLTDPVVVHANMVRGTIAKPTLDQIIHLYGVDALCRALVPAISREAALDEMTRLGQEFDAALKGESHD